MRTNKVSASKQVRTCGRCNKTIGIGEPYRWAKGRYTEKKIRCMDISMRLVSFVIE